MKIDTPFLDIRSFVMEEMEQSMIETSFPSISTFLPVYESVNGDGLMDPEAEEYITFFNELYDEEFNDAVSGLVDEARAVYEAQFRYEQEEPWTIGYQAERLLSQHFAPLVTEAEALFEGLGKRLEHHNSHTISIQEIETVLDQFQPSEALTPTFEDLWGALKYIAKKAVKVAKKGVGTLAKLGLGPILNKLKRLVKPLIQRVIRTAIGKLPRTLQPIARKLAERYGVLKNSENGGGSVLEEFETSEIAEIQYEFNYHVANLLFAPTEVEQELEVAQANSELQASGTDYLAELNQARHEFVENLQSLKEGEDPTPYVENFVPAILPALRIGIRLAGRQRVINFLAKYVSKLIRKFVGPQYASPLSRAIVDAGLRILSLETTNEDESRTAASAVAATVEETIRRVADLPDYVLDDQELLEGFALEAFEQAAAANLPAVLSENIYQKRPDLAEARKLRGMWIMMPRSRRKNGNGYKKFSRKIPIKFTPHKLSAVETFEGITLEEYLEEQLGVAPGEEVEAEVHLYESIPGTRLADIARLDENVPGLGTLNGHEQFHPLSREAAGLLLGESDLGRDNDSWYPLNPNSTNVGQRYYYLEIPGKRPLTTPGAAGRTKSRRPTRVRLILDFPKNEIRVYLFLSEIRAQEIAIKLRGRTHMGVVIARLRPHIFRGLGSAFKGARGRLKIVHEAVIPDQWPRTLHRLPSGVQQALLSKMREWVLKGLSDHLKQRPAEFVKAAEDTADGVTFVISIGNPPGFPQLREAIKGKGLSPSGLRLSEGTPTVKIRITPGYARE